jgi:hypothetical protein
MIIANDHSLPACISDNRSWLPEGTESTGINYREINHSLIEKIDRTKEPKIIDTADGEQNR